jgi:hypothetical protein
MTIRYANDLLLTELSRQINAEMASMNTHLRDGYLDAAFLGARSMQKKLDKLMDRLNELKYPETVPTGTP